jgi:purine nucleosidase
MKKTRMKKKVLLALAFLSLFTIACQRPGHTPNDDRSPTERSAPKAGSTLKGEDSVIPVILDTDANNELDDQHALAYLLLNEGTFDAIGVTANATYNGGGIEEHVKEARRIVRLCMRQEDVPVFPGADGNFPEIRKELEKTVKDGNGNGEASFDGKEAVDFIIGEALKERDRTLVLLPVGKLTNVALALLKEPSVADRVRIVWLGSNYPDPGEYNLENDTAAMNFVLRSGVPFEMVTGRYGKPGGTDEVTVSREEIYERMPGLGPRAAEAVEGRHGGSFTTFGDYSVSLFEHIGPPEEEIHRALFDMAAVAIVKNPSWASVREIPCPVYLDGQWVEQPDNPRKILIWENFDRDRIMADFFRTLEGSSQ